MIKYNMEDVIPTGVEGSHCGALYQAAGFLDSASLRSK
jgi:hypothetical protein